MNRAVYNRSSLLVIPLQWIAYLLQQESRMYQLIVGEDYRKCIVLCESSQWLCDIVLSVIIKMWFTHFCKRFYGIDFLLAFLVRHWFRSFDPRKMIQFEWSPFIKSERLHFCNKSNQRYHKFVNLVKSESIVIPECTAIFIFASWHANHYYVCFMYVSFVIVPGYIWRTNMYGQIQQTHSGLPDLWRGRSSLRGDSTHLQYVWVRTSPWLGFLVWCCIPRQQVSIFPF